MSVIVVLGATSCAEAAPDVPEPPDAITPAWAARHLLPHPSHPELWASVRGRPDLVRALYAVTRDSSEYLPSRMNALLLMAAGSDGTAARRLLALWEGKTYPGYPVALLLALGRLDPVEAEAEPGVYDVLEGALAEEQSAAAARALGDLGTPRALGILRDHLAREDDPVVRGQIERVLQSPGQS